MTTAEQQREIDNFLQSLHDQAVISFEKGNTLAAAYMATICGMWSNRFGRVKNLFDNDQDDNYLYKWFLNGHDDFSQAIQMSAEVRKKQLEKESADAEARAKGEEPQKKSKWALW